MPYGSPYDRQLPEYEGSGTDTLLQVGLPLALIGGGALGAGALKLLGRGAKAAVTKGMAPSVDAAAARAQAVLDERAIRELGKKIPSRTEGGSEALVRQYLADPAKMEAAKKSLEPAIADLNKQVAFNNQLNEVIRLMPNSPAARKAWQAQQALGQQIEAQGQKLVAPSPSLLQMKPKVDPGVAAVAKEPGRAAKAKEGLEGLVAQEARQQELANQLQEIAKVFPDAVPPQQMARLQSALRSPAAASSRKLAPPPGGRPAPAQGTSQPLHSAPVVEAPAGVQPGASSAVSAPVDRSAARAAIRDSKLWDPVPSTPPSKPVGTPSMWGVPDARAAEMAAVRNAPTRAATPATVPPAGRGTQVDEWRNLVPPDITPKVAPAAKTNVTPISGDELQRLLPPNINAQTDQARKALARSSGTPLEVAPKATPQQPSSLQRIQYQLRPDGTWYSINWDSAGRRITPPTKSHNAMGHSELRALGLRGANPRSGSLSREFNQLDLPPGIDRGMTRSIDPGPRPAPSIQNLARVENPHGQAVLSNRSPAPVANQPTPQPVNASTTRPVATERPTAPQPVTQQLTAPQQSPAASPTRSPHTGPQNVTSQTQSLSPAPTVQPAASAQPAAPAIREVPPPPAHLQAGTPGQVQARQTTPPAKPVQQGGGTASVGTPVGTQAPAQNPTTAMSASPKNQMSELAEPKSSLTSTPNSMQPQHQIRKQAMSRGAWAFLEKRALSPKLPNVPKMPTPNIRIPSITQTKGPRNVQTGMMPQQTSPTQLAPLAPGTAPPPNPVPTPGISPVPPADQTANLTANPKPPKLASTLYKTSAYYGGGFGQVNPTDTTIASQPVPPELTMDREPNPLSEDPSRYDGKSNSRIVPPKTDSTFPIAGVARPDAAAYSNMRLHEVFLSEPKPDPQPAEIPVPLGMDGAVPYTNDQNVVDPSQMNTVEGMAAEKVGGGLPRNLELALELGGLGTLAVPSAYNLIHGEPKEEDKNSAFHRMMQSQTTHDLAEVGGLGMLATPYLAELGKKLINRVRL